VLRLPGKLRPLQPGIKGAQLLLELEANLGIVHMILVFCRHAECKSFRIMEASIQIAREALEARQCGQGQNSCM
jgi:hypothetical protein